jgi:NAD(P)-dependent dehydrogenase (short-subunit alcohol dehydrogenase family)
MMAAASPISLHRAFSEGQTAVITGGASGIGLAAAKRFAAGGLNVVIADLPGERLEQARRGLAAIGGDSAVRAMATDVSDIAQVQQLKAEALAAFGSVSVVMNNAGIGRPAGRAWQDYERWRKILDSNLIGVINGVQVFVPDLVARNQPALVINTGSKQGITSPPGNAAYNVAKAGVKALTEQVAHELRNVPGCQVTAHLLVPGSTYTGLSSAKEKPPGSWTPEQVIDYMLAHIGDFYILCPDNDVTRQMDERRIQWAADDLIMNRPALSRWHPDFKDAFQKFLKG